MKLTIWFSILVLNLIITIQKSAEANTPLFRKKAKQECKGFAMACVNSSECCSGACKMRPVNSGESDGSEEPEKICDCTRDNAICLKKKDCCDDRAVCRNKRCSDVQETDCGKACKKGSDCFDCPHCKNGICSKATAKCDEPCPSGSSYECLSGGLCMDKICTCGMNCKRTNEECKDKSECCKNACQRIGQLLGSRRVCA